MPDRKTFISIVIPVYNSMTTIFQTIEGCMRQDYPEDSLEIIVVDDGSQDDIKEVIRNYKVKYLYQDRKGPASARNNGWKNAKGEGVCFIDADCVPSPDWVSCLEKHFSQNNIAAIAGSYDVKGSKYLLDKFVHYEIRHRHLMMPVSVNSFGTYNVLVKRSVLKELDGFDPLYFTASGEDTDLSYRIKKKGYDIYFEKNALVSHYNVLRFFKYMKIQFKHSYWRMRLYRTNIGMIRKDEYGYWKDFLEIVLILGFSLSLFCDLYIAIAILLFLYAIQIPLALKISREQKDIRYIFFSLATFIRSFVRVLGGFLGFLSFWIFKK